MECHQHRIQRLRDNPDCADAEFDRVFDDADVGLTPRVLFDATVNVAAPMIDGLASQSRDPARAGVNSHMRPGTCSRWLASMPTMYVHDRPADRSSALDEFKGLCRVWWI